MGVLLCGGAAVLLLVYAVREGFQMRRLRIEGIRTHGVVVDNVRTTDSDGPMWVPVIAFTDQRGYRVEFSPKARGTGMGLATGRQVPVIYFAHNPQNARVLMRRHMTGTVWCTLFGGLVFLGAAVWISLS
ncbi:DUF3592 domain-containing protein [Streptomyces sp. uw30]|uniref:DUF3592 domain-containing protein n=1 Tax=Streptomyces sp. uw30 TaxID=1828179 RepID=UPI0011CEA39F|nr:DUF3592 domain-containing protein [Streptomyces sp. uw30]TXS40880.1 DUF3592 domain-containing protein [Streptomyces sp. uw30]